MPPSQGPPSQGFSRENQGHDHQQHHRPPSGFHDAPNFQQQGHPIPEVSQLKQADLDKPKEHQPRKRKSRWDPIPEEKSQNDANTHQPLEPQDTAGWPGTPQLQNQWKPGPGPAFSQNGNLFLGGAIDNRNSAEVMMDVAVQEAVLREQVSLYLSFGVLDVCRPLEGAISL